MGGSGGGGGSGKVDYPVHMKTFHTQALNKSGLDVMNQSMVDLVNIALVTNPYTGLVPYTGRDEMDFIDVELDKTILYSDSLDCVNWQKALVKVTELMDAELFNSDVIDKAVQSYTDVLDNELQERAYPTFEAGMRDINAVMSSAFVVGRAIIENERITRITQYDADLRYKAFMQKNELVANSINSFLEWYLKVYEAKKTSAMLAVDVKRTRVISEREYNEADAKFAHLEATWEFEAFMYAGNFLASIGGGTYVPPVKGMSSGQSALGGMLSGAAMGTSIGGPGWGTVIGGVIGGIGGLLSS